MNPRIRRNNANSNKNTVPSMIAASVMVASLLTLSALTMNPFLLVMATEEVKNNDLDNTNDFSSVPTMPAPPPQQSMSSGSTGTVMGTDSSSGSSFSPPFTIQEQEEQQPQQQEQGMASLTEGATTKAACGQVASGVVELTSDLNCSGDGIIISGPNTVINMNGFSIIGPGQESSKVGMMVSNVDNVVVNGPGSISNFQAGVLLTGANGFKLSSAVLENNQIAVFMTGAENAELHQNIMQNNNLGIASHSTSGSKITSNLMSGNLVGGITLVNTRNSHLDMNNIHGSQNGVFLDGQSFDNAVNANNVLENVIDINNANGLPTNINANQYTENNCETSNPSGLCTGR
jgi:parallel beta-helix repeat protein